jgi:hypothetical protein
MAQSPRALPSWWAPLVREAPWRGQSRAACRGRQANPLQGCCGYWPRIERWLAGRQPGRQTRPLPPGAL